MASRGLVRTWTEELAEDDPADMRIPIRVSEPNDLEDAPLCHRSSSHRGLREIRSHKHLSMVPLFKKGVLGGAFLLVLGLLLARFGPSLLGAFQQTSSTDELAMLSDADMPSQSTSEFVTNAEGVKTFAWSAPVRTVYSSLYDALKKEGVEGTGPMTFSDSNHTKRKWTEVAAWVDSELFKEGQDPFAAHHGRVPVPWPKDTDGSDQLAPGQYVGYTRRQVCYIVAKTLVGANTTGYNNGLQRLMETRGSSPPDCLPRLGDFGKTWWGLLAACAADPGLKDGGQGPMLLVAKPGKLPDMESVRNMSKEVPMSSAGLRVCRYDDGGHGDGPPGMLEAVPEQGCKQPSSSGPGKDFMTGGLERQATQDISASFLGGYVFGNTCGLGGGQDTRLMVYFPEVAALTFFLSEAPGSAKNSNPPQLRQPAWILGARRLLHGIDGTARFNHFKLFDPSIPLTSDLVDIELKGKTYSISGSRPFLGFMSENHNFISPTDTKSQRLARRNKEPRQREVSGDSSYAFDKQVRAWYRAVALSSYDDAMRPALKKLVGSLGAGPWLAGLWWGDSQIGFLVSWLGHALAASTWGENPVALDYYLYSGFTENPGNQCFVHSRKACEACLLHCHAFPLPSTSFWLPPGLESSLDDPCVGALLFDCGRYGIEDTFEAYKHQNASVLWDDVEATLARTSPDTEHSVFDLLLE